jgi:hypothetical protein
MTYRARCDGRRLRREARKTLFQLEFERELTGQELSWWRSLMVTTYSPVVNEKCLDFIGRVQFRRDRPTRMLGVTFDQAPPP